MPTPEDSHPEPPAEANDKDATLLDLLNHMDLDQPLTNDPRDHARERAAVQRMLTNLGLEKSRVSGVLADATIADVVSTWTGVLDHPAALAHRGDQRSLTFDVRDTAVANWILANSSETGLELTVTEAVNTDENVVRVTASVAVPDLPVPDDDLVVSMTFTDDGRIVRLPVRGINGGDEDFPLYELTGGVTLTGLRGHVQRAWIEFDEISEDD